MNSRIYAKCDTIIGTVYIVSQNQHIVSIHLGEEDFLREEEVDHIKYTPEDLLLSEAIKQMDEYFGGVRQEFDLPILIQGTEFRQSVWQELSKIPFGETRSYQAIAEAIGNPKAVRAVGQANKANKLPIIIPCHRVIGKNQSLTGYAGTRTDIKEKLLMIEGAQYQI